jgi:glutaconyl-CoA/methylmalonyl-CoA decarboxylase subunit gamma
MKKFKVYVDGQPFEVVVEEITDAGVQKAASPPTSAAIQKEQPASTTAPSAPAPVTQPEKVAAAPEVNKTAGGVTVPAPMPGSVLDVKVKVGDNVNEGDALLILEAMKMENEVSSPASGVVKSINVAVGASVNTGDVMMIIE